VATGLPFELSRLPIPFTACTRTWQAAAQIKLTSPLALAQTNILQCGKCCICRHQCIGKQA